MATRKPKTDGAQPTTYRALTRIEHDDVLYLPGDAIALDDVAAEPLLAVRAIELDAQAGA